MNRLERIYAAALLLLAFTVAPGAAATDEAFEGTWNWGEPWRSTDVPFLQISRKGATWAVKTKHYMHDSFVSTTKDIRISGYHLEFTYWYEPLARWSSCRLDLAEGKMSGFCDGELNARGQWGAVPTYLWHANR